jgi:hypothetical protein
VLLDHRGQIALRRIRSEADRPRVPLREFSGSTGLRERCGHRSRCVACSYPLSRRRDVSVLRLLKLSLRSCDRLARGPMPVAQRDRLVERPLDVSRTAALGDDLDADACRRHQRLAIRSTG